MFDKIFKILNRKAASAVEKPFVYDEAVLITSDINENSEDVQRKVLGIEDSIKSLLPENSGIDGHDLSEEEFIIYIYGPSADKIWERIEQSIRTRLDTATITLQYGRPEDAATTEKTFQIARS